MKRTVIVLLMGIAGMASLGCNLDRAAQEGVLQGTQSAVASVVATPITFWLEQIFSN